MYKCYGNKRLVKQFGRPKSIIFVHLKCDWAVIGHIGTLRPSITRVLAIPKNHFEIQFKNQTSNKVDGDGPGTSRFVSYN